MLTITKAQDLILLSENSPSQSISSILLKEFVPDPSQKILIRKNVFAKTWSWLRSLPPEEKSIRSICKNLILQEPRSLDQASPSIRSQIIDFAELKTPSLSIPSLEVDLRPQQTESLVEPVFEHASLFFSKPSVASIQAHTLESIWGHRVSIPKETYKYLEQFAKKQLSEKDLQSFYHFFERLQRSETQDLFPYHQVHSLATNQTYLHRTCYGNANFSIRDLLKTFLSRMDGLELTDINLVTDMTSDPESLINDLSEKAKDFLKDRCPTLEIPKIVKTLFPNSSRSLPKSLQKRLPKCLKDWMESIMKKGVLSFITNPYSEEFNSSDQSLEYLIRFLHSEDREQMIDDLCINIHSYIEQGVLSLAELEHLFVKVLHITNKLPITGQSVMHVDGFLSRGFLWFEFTKKEEETFDVSIYGIGSHLSYLSESFPLTYKGVSKDLLNEEFFHRLFELENPPDITTFRKEDIFNGLLQILDSKNQRKSPCKEIHRSFLPTDLHMTMSYLLQELDLHTFHQKFKMQALIDYCKPFYQNGILTFDQKGAVPLQNILPDLRRFASQCSDPKEKALLLQVIEQIQISLKPFQSSSLLKIDFSQSLLNMDLVDDLKDKIEELFVDKTLSFESTPTQNKSTIWNILEDIFEGFLFFIQEFFMTFLSKLFPHFWALPILSFFHFLSQKVLLKTLTKKDVSETKHLISQTASLALCGPSYFLTLQMTHHLLKMLLPKNILTHYQNALLYLKRQITQAFVDLTLRLIGEPQLMQVLEAKISQIKQVVSEAFKALKENPTISFKNPHLKKEEIHERAPLIAKEVLFYEGKIPPSNSFSFSVISKLPNLMDFTPYRLKEQLQTWNQNFLQLSNQDPKLAIEYFCKQTSRLPIPSISKCPFWGSIQSTEVLSQLSDLHLQFSLSIAKYIELYLQDGSSQIWIFDWIIPESVAISSISFLAIFDYLCRHDCVKNPYQERTGFPLFEQMVRKTHISTRDYHQISRILNLCNYFQEANPLPSYHQICEEFYGLSTYSHPMKTYLQTLLKQPRTLSYLASLEIDINEMSEENLITILSHELLNTFYENSPIPSSFKKLFFHEKLTTTLTKLCFKKTSIPFFHKYLMNFLNDWAVPKKYTYSDIASSPVLTQRDALLNPLVYDESFKNVSQFCGGYVRTNLAIFQQRIGIKKAPLSLRTLEYAHTFPQFNHHPLGVLVDLNFVIPRSKIFIWSSNVAHIKIEDLEARSQEELISHFSNFPLFSMDSVFCDPTDRMIRIMHALNENPSLLIDNSYIESGIYSDEKTRDFYSLLFSIFFSFNHLRKHLDARFDILKVISEWIQQNLHFIQTSKDPFSYLHFIEFGISVQIYCEVHLQRSYDNLFPNWQDMLLKIPHLSHKTPNEMKKTYQMDLKLKKALLEIKLMSQNSSFSRAHFLLSCKTFFYIKIHRPNFLQLNTQNQLMKEMEDTFTKHARNFLEEHSLSKRCLQELLFFLDLTEVDFCSFSYQKIDNYTYVLGPFKIDFIKGISRTDNIPLVAKDLCEQDPLIQTLIQKEQIHFSEQKPGYFLSCNQRYTIQCKETDYTVFFHHESRSYVYIENPELFSICMSLFPTNRAITLWLEKTSSSQKQILMKDISSTDIQGQITIEDRDGNYHLMKIDDLMYVDTTCFQQQLFALQKFCSLDQILCFVHPNCPEVLQKIILRPFHLTFIRKDEKMYSEKFPGFFLAHNQSVKGFPVASILVLENLKGKKKILLPKHQDLVMGIEAMIGPRLSQLMLHPFISEITQLSINPNSYLSQSTKNLTAEIEIIIAAFNFILVLPEHFHQQVDPKFALSPKEKWFILQSSLRTIKQKIPLPLSVIDTIPDEVFLFFMGASTEFIDHYQHLKMTFDPQAPQKISRVLFNPNLIKECYNSIERLSSAIPHLIGLFSKNLFTPLENVPFLKGDGFDLILSRLIQYFRPDDIHNASQPITSFSFFSKLLHSLTSATINHDICLERAFVRAHLFKEWPSFYSIAKNDAGKIKKEKLQTSLYLLKGGWDLPSQQFIDLLIEVTTTSASFPPIEDLLSAQSHNLAHELPQDTLSEEHSKNKRKPMVLSKTQKTWTLANYKNMDSYFIYTIEEDQFTSDHLPAKLFLLTLSFLNQKEEVGQSLYKSLERELKTAPFHEEFVIFLHYLTIPSLVNPTANWIRLKLSSLIAEKSLLTDVSPAPCEKMQPPPPPLHLLKKPSSSKVPSSRLEKTNTLVKKQCSKKHTSFSKKTPTKQAALHIFLEETLSLCRRSWAKKELSKLILQAGYQSLALLPAYSIGKILSKTTFIYFQAGALTVGIEEAIHHIKKASTQPRPVLYRKREDLFTSSKNLQKIEEEFQQIFDQIHTFIFFAKDSISLKSSIAPLSGTNCKSQKRLNQSLEQYQRHLPNKRRFSIKPPIDLWQGYQLFRHFSTELSTSLEQEKQQLLQVAKEHIDFQIEWEDLVIFYLQSRSRFAISQSFSLADFEKAMGLLLLKMSWQNRCEEVQKTFDAYFDTPSERTLQKLETFLSTKRSYHFDGVFPERFIRALLAMEALSKQLFWSIQIEVIQKAYEINKKLSSTLENTCLELLMGMGKTSKIFPLQNLMRTLQGEKPLMINLFPTPLIASMQRNLARTLFPLGQSLTGGIVIDRQMQMNLSTLQSLQTVLIEAIEYGNSFCFSQQSLQAFELLFLETLIKGKNDKKSELLQMIPYYQHILLLLKNYGMMIADEAHKIFTPQEELIFPLGSKQFYPEEHFEVIQKFLEYYFEIDKTFLEYIFKNNLMDYPKKQFQKFSQSAARNMGTEFFHLSEKILPSWLRFIMGYSCAPMEIQHHPQYEKMCLLRGCIQTLIPAILDEPLGIKYGQSNDPSVTYVKPMEGREHVKENSIFQNLDETVVKTLIMYLSQGLSEEQFWQTIKVLCKKIERKLCKKIHPDRIKEYQILNQYSHLKLAVEDFVASVEKTNSLNKRKEIYQLLKRNPTLIFTYIPVGVLPQIHSYTDCIRSTAYNLASMFQRHTTMTGTPYNFEGYPNHHCIFLNTQAEALEGISRNLVQDFLPVSGEGAQENLSSIIQALQRKKDVKALIDAGAFMKNIPNREVAQILSQNLPHLKGIVFFDKNDQNLDEPFIYERGTAQTKPLLQSDILPNQRMVYYDLFHCFGADIEIMEGTNVFLTYSPQTSLNTLTQGAFRLRALRDPFCKAHQIFLVVHVSDKDKDFSEIVQNALKQQDLELTLKYLPSYLMRIENEVRRSVLEKILHSPPKKAVELITKYRSIFVTRLASDLKRYGIHKEQEPVDNLIQRLIQNLLDPLQRGEDFDSDELSLIREKIHSLSKPPLPNKVQTQIATGAHMQMQIDSEQEQEQEQEQAVNVLISHSSPRPVYEPIEWPASMDPFTFDFRDYLLQKASYLNWFRSQFSVLYLCDLLRSSNTSYVQKLSSYFSKKIWTSINFHPKGVDFASIEQRSVYQVIFHGQMENGELKITSVGCLSQKDAAYWKESLWFQEPSTEHIAILYDIHLRAILAGSEFDLDIFRSHLEVQQIETMLHFLNGDLIFHNLEILQNWVSQNQTLFKRAFQEIYFGRDRPSEKLLTESNLDFLI